MLLKKWSKITAGILVLSVIFLLSACGGKEKSTSHPVEVTNATGQEFANIMIIPAGSDEVSDDYLPSDGFPDGAIKSLPFSGDPKQEMWDIVVSCGDGTLVWSEVPLFTISSITLSYSGGETSFQTAP